MTQEPTDQDLQDAAADATAIDELEALRAEIDQLKAQSLLERADLENQRKRLGRELEMARKFANERLLGDLLPVLDSLEAGLANAPADDPLRAGLELTQRDFERLLEKHGIRRIEPKGEKFDPNLHQAMFEAPDATVAKGLVSKVVQIGYKIGERVLRPALVGVSAGAPKV